MTTPTALAAGIALGVLLAVAVADARRVWLRRRARRRITARRAWEQAATPARPLWETELEPSAVRRLAREEPWQ